MNTSYIKVKNHFVDTGQATDSDAIDGLFSKFDTLKKRNRIKGQEKDINFWKKQGFTKFHDFVNKEHDLLIKKDKEKDKEKNMKREPKPTDSSFSNLIDLANNSTSAEELNRLSKHDNKWIRKTVAYNEHTPKSALMALANEKDVYISYYVAYNSSTPEQTLEKIYHDYKGGKDGAVGIMGVLAKNKNTPEYILDELYDLNINVIRRDLAINRNSSDELLGKLTQSEDEITANIAKNMLNIRKNSEN